MAQDDTEGEHAVSFWAKAPDQSETRPSERRIGQGLRSDGPNGQSSTPQHGADSTVELQGADEGALPHGNDRGWLGRPSLMAHIHDVEPGPREPRD